METNVARSPVAATGFAATWGFGLCLAGAALGVIGLWAVLLPKHLFQTLLPGYPAMVPNTGLSLILLGVAGALRRARPAPQIHLFLSLIAALLVLTIGVGTLAEYAGNLQTGLDQLTFHTDRGVYAPGRPHPLTAMALVFLATAVLIFDWQPGKSIRPSESCALGAGVIGATILLEHLFGSWPLVTVAGTLVRGVALPTGVGILVISLGLLLERPDAGLMRLVTSPGPGSVLLRRVAPLAVVAPVGFALLSLYLLRLGNQSQTEFVLASTTVASVFASLLLLSFTASRLARAHETIARIQSETRDLIDLASDAIFVADTNGRYLDVNLAGQRMFGFSREELLSKAVKDLIPPQDLPRLETQRQALLAGAVRVGNWDILCKDGSLLPTEVSAKILPDGRWLAFIRNISARKRTERHQQLLLALGTALPGMLGFDEALSEIVRLCIHYLADICIVDLLENGKPLTRAQVRWRDPSKAVAGQGLSRLHFADEIPIANIIGGTSPVLYESLTPAALASCGLDGEQGEELRGAGFSSALEIPLRARGKAMGRLVLMTTGLRRFDKRDLSFAEALGTLVALSLENKRLFRQATESATARDQILGYVAHDLRNPLQAIGINSATLFMSGDKNTREIGSEMQTAVRRMDRLIQDLLDITRLEAGQFRLKRERLPVSELIEDVLQSQKVLASAAGIRIEVAVPRFLPDILADRDRILQVFENLIGNAIKFSKAGGSITLAAEGGPDELVLSVADTGSGIAEKDLPHLFDRYWQAAQGKGMGAGLGLAIVKGIVAAHGGRVWVTSTIGKGSRFYFSIPTASVGARPRIESAITPAAAS